MNNKKKMMVFILGIAAIAIIVLVAFIFYFKSDTVQIHRQLELAQHYLLKEEYEQAIEAFNTVTEIDPKNVEAYIGLAQAYTDNGDLENAIKTLEKGYEETKAKEIQELKVIRIEELAQIKTLKQEETVLTTDIKFQPEGAEIATTNTTLSESTVQPEEITPVQTGFVTQDGELYYYDEQGNMAIGWFEVNSKRYCAKSDGKLYRDGVYEVESIQYLFGKNGSCLGKMPEMESENGEQNGCLVIVQAYQLDEYSGYEVYGYDGQGRLREAYYYPSKRETYSYDEQNRLSEIEYGGGGMSSYEVCSYDKQGKLNQLEYYYSSTGEWNRYDGHDVYSYDEQGRLSKSERYDSNGNLRSGVYSYDEQNRLHKIENYNSNKELESYEVYSYDGQSRLSKYEYYNSDGRLGFYRVYSYDGQGRLSKSEWYYSDSSLYYYKVYSYDGQSKLVTNELAYFECLGMPIAYILTR